jgi:hypothetical protein
MHPRLKLQADILCARVKREEDQKRQEERQKEGLLFFNL